MLPEVRDRIAAAAERAGRDPVEVTLVAVTKGHEVDEIRSAVLAHGHRTLGENRVQEWRRKAEGLGGEVDWHIIGTVQRNKAKYLVPVALIHTLNSERLADALETEGAKRSHVFRTLVEVDIANEAAKQGVAPQAAGGLVRHAASLAHVEVLGLMAMAPYSTNPEHSRPHFRALRRLRDTLGVPHLSMGMSGDFEVAVEEGATIVRVGTALFT